MKALCNIIIASALLSAAFGQAPERRPKPEEGREGPPREGPIREEIIKKFDKDGDGKLNDEEAAAARAAMQARRGEMDGKYKEMIAKFDKDGDGKLNEDERKAAHAAMEKEMLAKFDKDGDGKLSDEEKKAAREAMGGLRPPGGPRGPERKKDAE